MDPDTPAADGTREGDGRFRPGASGNPRGRPPRGGRGVLVSMLDEARERGMNRHGFQALLAAAWRKGGVDLELVAGSRARVISWLRYADFADVSLPWLSLWCGLHLLPARPLVLWRGGRGPPAEVANSNMSWTLSRPAAAWFALLTVRSPDDALRPPVLLRRRATRDQALAYFATREREVVMPDPGPYTLETPGSAALERLAGTLREGPVHGRFGDLGREES